MVTIKHERWNLCNYFITSKVVVCILGHRTWSANRARDDVNKFSGGPVEHVVAAETVPNRPLGYPEKNPEKHDNFDLRACYGV